MAEVGLIFTTDYEIFGNGSGSVEKCMIAPTDRMATMLEKYGATLTLFVDVCEYWAFEKEYEKGLLKQDWAGMIRAQLQDLARRGHNVQLHFHPQWIDYSFDGNTWSLNYDLWRLGRLKYENAENPEQGLKHLFAKGKKTLEDIVKPVDPDYRCHIFRAGAWSMQPEADALRAMIENGFDIDSTVAPGLAFQDDFTFYDFRKSPESGSWGISDNLTIEDTEGAILEIPIFTTEISLIDKAKFLGLKKSRKVAMKPEGCSGISLATQGKGKLSKVMELVSEKRKMFTFGDGICAEEMIFYTERAIKKCERLGSSKLPLVAISHPKTFANEDEFDKFLQWCETKAQVTFAGFDEFKT